MLKKAPQMGSRSPSWPQLGLKMAILAPTWGNLAPSWLQLGPILAQFGEILTHPNCQDLGLWAKCKPTAFFLQPRFLDRALAPQLWFWIERRPQHFPSLWFWYSPSPQHRRGHTREMRPSLQAHLTTHRKHEPCCVRSRLDCASLRFEYVASRVTALRSCSACRSNC